MSLHFSTPVDWLNTVLENFDVFLLDHASAERKASATAMTLVAHYPDQLELVKQMIDLAIEELSHFKGVVKILNSRNLVLANDKKDVYVNRFRKAIRKGSEAYMIDRLIVAGIIEARGQERFAMVAEALPPGSLKNFYQSISQSEDRHAKLFLHLAKKYSKTIDVDAREHELLAVEADIVQKLPFTGALH